MKDVVIVGGGIGGLTAGIRLGLAGYNVRILEKNPEVGGKLSRLVEGGHTFDLGPTVLTMPFVLENLFAACGRRLEDRLELMSVDPACRYNWADGTRFDAYGDRNRLLDEVERCFPEDVRAVARFLDDSETVYEATKDVFLFNPFRGIRELFSLRNSRLLPLLGSLGFTSTMHDSLKKRFKSDKLVQLFSRFATYNGSSPYSAPATLNVIPHVEFGYGAWYPRGGMYAIVEALAELAEQVGVRIETGVEVEGAEIDDGAIRRIKANGDTIKCDVLISNVDALWTWQTLLAPNGISVPRTLEKAERSCSGFLITAGVRGEHPQLLHHNVFFGDAYREEFADIFDRKRLPENMTIYLSVASRTDPALAPAGEENWYILVNAPSGGDSFGNDEACAEYADAIMERLAWFGVAPDVQTVHRMTPYEIAVRYNSPGGAIYGSSSNSILSAFLRPENRVKKVENMFLVGGSTHPGGGVPLVMLSGTITAGMIVEQFGGID